MALGQYNDTIAGSNPDLWQVQIRFNTGQWHQWSQQEKCYDIYKKWHSGIAESIQYTCQRIG